MIRFSNKILYRKRQKEISVFKGTIDLFLHITQINKDSKSFQITFVVASKNHENA